MQTPAAFATSHLRQEVPVSDTRAWLALPLAAALWAPPTAAAETTRQLTLDLRGDPGGSFAVENLAGTLQVRSGSGATVRVAVTVHAEDEALAGGVRLEQVAGKRDVPTLRVRYPSDTRRIRYPEAEGGWIGSGRHRLTYDGQSVEVSPRRGTLLYADVVVEVPSEIGDALFSNRVGTVSAEGIAGRELVFDTASGPIRLERVDGDVRADTGSGDVDAVDLRGRYRCDTGSGECRLDGFEGEQLDCDTGSGQIRIESVQAERVKLDTGSGDIEATGVVADRLDADTGSGDVRVEADGRSLRSVRADTGSGRVESGFEDAEPIRRRNEIVGYRRGDGRTTIRVDTGSGDVRVEP
jgi:Toastrack DUF4097